MEGRVASTNIAAQNTFTAAFFVRAGEAASISISGTFSGTVTLQRDLIGDGSWRDVEAYTSEVERTYVAEETCYIRLGIKTGAYSSGTAVARIGSAS